MRILQSQFKRPLNLLAVAAGGQVAGACSMFLVRGDVDVWDMATGNSTVFPAPDATPCGTIAFLPGGRHLLTSFGDQGLIIHELESRIATPWPDCSTTATRSRLAPTRVAVNTRTGMVLATDTLLPTSCISCWSFRESGDPDVQHIWHIQSSTADAFGTPAISPDGKWVAVSVRSAGLRPRNTVEIRNAADGGMQCTIEHGGENPLERIDFSADSRTLLAHSTGRSVKLFRAETGAPVGELVSRGRPYITAMAVHPNGIVACARSNGTVDFRNPDSGELIRTIDWKLGTVVSAAFSPDGSLGAAGTEDGRVIVWDVDE